MGVVRRLSRGERLSRGGDRRLGPPVILCLIILMLNLNGFIKLLCFRIPIKKRLLIFHVKLEWDNRLRVWGLWNNKVPRDMSTCYFPI